MIKLLNTTILAISFMTVGVSIASVVKNIQIVQRVTVTEKRTILVGYQ